MKNYNFRFQCYLGREKNSIHIHPRRDYAIRGCFAALGLSFLTAICTSGKIIHFSLSMYNVQYISLEGE